MNDMQIITINREQHKLEGIDVIEYLYDHAEKTLVINADGVELRSYQGSKATRIYNKMAE